MGLRFRKSIKIAPGIRVNVGLRSSSVSFGGRGCRYSINTRGRRTSTIGIPGTGLSYSVSNSNKRKRSYNSKAYSNRSSIQQQLKQLNKLEETSRNTLLVNQYENYLDLIKNVHRECDDQVLWQNIVSEPEPFPIGTIGPKEQEVRNSIESFRPTFFEKLFLKNGEKRLQELSAKMVECHDADLDDYKAWDESVNFAQQILCGNIDSYYAAIEEADPFEDLVRFGSGFEFGTDSANFMEIEFMVKSSEVVPTTSKMLTKTGKLSEKTLGKTAYYDITQDYVCSCAIRLAREIFALLPVNVVIVHATDSILNTATGNDELKSILSVAFTRTGFNNVDTDRIDASDFVQTFNHNMIFKKTSGFQPIDRILA